MWRDPGLGQRPERRGAWGLYVLCREPRDGARSARFRRSVRSHAWTAGKHACTRSDGLDKIGLARPGDARPARRLDTPRSDADAAGMSVGVAALWDPGATEVWWVPSIVPIPSKSGSSRFSASIDATPQGRRIVWRRKLDHRMVCNNARFGSVLYHRLQIYAINVNLYEGVTGERVRFSNTPTYSITTKQQQSGRTQYRRCSCPSTQPFIEAFNHLIAENLSYSDTSSRLTSVHYEI